MATCNMDCFNCKHDDCVASYADIVKILKHEARRRAWRRAYQREWTAEARRKAELLTGVAGTLPATIRELREQRGWTQLRLAKELGVSQSTVHLWERGIMMPGEKNMRQLAKVFSRSYDDFLDARAETQKRKATMAAATAQR